MLLGQYVIEFCRFALVIVFAYSGVSKALNLAAFQDAIRNFDLVSAVASRFLAFLFVAGEMIACIALAIGEQFLFWGFLMVLVLLFMFTLALWSVLNRHIRTSCSCFGPTPKEISIYTIHRNLGLMLCAAIGLGLQLWLTSRTALSVPEYLMLGLAAALTALGYLNFEEIQEFITL